MDKETIALVEDVRKSLVDFGKKQTGSALKKTRKITSQIIWEPGPYLNELDDILSSSATKEEAVMRVRSLVRSSEEAALKSMTLLPDDTGAIFYNANTKQQKARIVSDYISSMTDRYIIELYNQFKSDPSTMIFKPFS